MIRVKICGVTRLEDAVIAIKAGADYLGFILYPPSPRAIATTALATLVTELRRKPDLATIFSNGTPPLLVGVFVNKTPLYAAGVLDSCGLDLAQLSGDEEATQITDRSSPLYGRAYKALRPGNIEFEREVATYYANYDDAESRPRPRILIDTQHETLYGGTGQTGNWKIAQQLAAHHPGFMLAGGLTPNNVAEAVRQVRPFAVDVAGGVESAPGLKDHALVRAFIANAKST